MLIDTHCHLYSEAFDDDRDQMIGRARERGVELFYLPAIDSSYTESMYRLEDQYPDQMRLMMGLHPTSVKANFKEELEHVFRQFEARDFWAVGEIGIDLYWDKSTIAWQIDAFHQQIELAKSKQLPIVIHCRESFDEIFDVLEQHRGPLLRGIFHCFTGTLDQANQAIDLGMKLGIGGVVTFKNGKIDQFLDQVEMKHLVLETDSPYLSPVPYRGKRNESSYLSLVCEKLAQVYDVTPNEVARETTKNAMEVFEKGIKKS
ncbi:TatD family hydrolase [Aureitalea marina]|uniref:Hydrolase TatD n=1 Tax=Aureitalea marina TaxID=930804 RepID=A0A2S7KRM2_9FLAO|nr:TatD family hydrolase [Aureitalea marina]PQB05203.1 hydrolase TatD [Aureitalea marina]